jgi:hypothetical protein
MQANKYVLNETRLVCIEEETRCKLTYMCFTRLASFAYRRYRVSHELSLEEHSVDLRIDDSKEKSVVTSVLA